MWLLLCQANLMELVLSSVQATVSRKTISPSYFCQLRGQHVCFLVQGSTDHSLHDLVVSLFLSDVAMKLTRWSRKAVFHGTVRFRVGRWARLRLYHGTKGHGSKLNHQGTAGVRRFHLPGLHLEYLFLIHGHISTAHKRSQNRVAPFLDEVSGLTRSVEQI